MTYPQFFNCNLRVSKSTPTRCVACGFATQCGVSCRTEWSLAYLEDCLANEWVSKWVRVSVRVRVCPGAVWVEFVESTPPKRVDKSFQWRLATTHGSPPLHRGEWIHLICIRLCIVNNFYAYFRLYHERLIGQAIKSHRVWFGKLLTTYLRYNFMPFVGSRQSIIVCHCRTAHTLPRQY